MADISFQPAAQFASSTSSSSAQPTGTTDIYANPNDDDENTGGSTVNYYFIVLAFVLAVSALVVYVSFKRRRQQRLRVLPGEAVPTEHMSGRGGGHGGHGWTTWERMQRPYWQERWHGAQASREEGLNEHGEAPPPYVPKRQSQEGRGGEGPAVPMQTLSRDHAGLKPPEYSQASVEDEGAHMRPTYGEGSSRTT